MDHVSTFNPARPNEQVGEVALLDAAAVDVAIAACLDGQRQWAASPTVRADALDAWASALQADREETAELIAREVGKPLREAGPEVDRGIRILRYYAQAVYDARGRIYPAPGATRLEVEREALGTVLVITPWNFPIAIPLWKIAPALAWGNAVLFRPSSMALATAEHLCRLAPDLLMDTALRLIPTGADAAGRLVEDPRIDGVSFTGSTDVGRQIVRAAASRGAPVQAEMGGQNPSIVLEDADLEHAAGTIAEAAMGYAGQKCTATSRVIVDRSIGEQFTRRLVEAVERLPVGDPLSADTIVGPVVSEGARAKVSSSVTAAVERGASILSGGGAIRRDGWFWQPTLLENVAPDDEFANEETFGPTASVHVVDSPQDAVRLANGTKFGLSGAVFGRDVTRAADVARRLRVGMVRVNASTAGVDFYAPFGGVGDSSFGPREQGRAAREFYTTTRTILVNSV